MDLRIVFLFTSLMIFPGCTSLGSGHSLHPSLTGEFEDDYGITYSITSERWIQHPGSTYLITKWDAEEQYLIAQNGPDNPTSAGLWTRIDWMELEGMQPYAWAFCLSAYEAPTAEEAEQVQIADRGNPRTGCNGFPFSRMKRSL
jgi:hypothetical protein